MKGIIEGVDENFTHVRLEDGELRLFNHKGLNRVEGMTAGQKVDIDRVREEGPMLGLLVVKAVAPEAKVPIRRSL